MLNRDLIQAFCKEGVTAVEAVLLGGVLGSALGMGTQSGSYSC
jgi:hypothetical protein